MKIPVSKKFAAAGACLLLLMIRNPAWSGEARLLETLKSSSDPVERCEVCRQLLADGTPASVPHLAAVLEEDRVGHAALHTLERMPFPEAGAALREAAGTLPRPIRVGVIDALGWRKDAEALPLLARWIEEPDASVAAVSASALGRIGGPQAVATLTRMSLRKETASTVRLAILESLLACAGQLRVEKQNREAAAIYRRLLEAETPPPMRNAALAGLLLTDPDRRREIFLDAVGSPDPRVRGTAMRARFGREGDELFMALLERWPSLPPDVKTSLLEQPARLGDKFGATVRTAATDEEEMVRLAALRAMGETGDVSLIPVLVRAAVTTGKEEQIAARRSLARIHGSGVGEGLVAFLVEASTGERTELLRALGERRDPGAAEVLLRHVQSTDPAERDAALHALYLLADPETLGPLEKLIRDPAPEADRKKMQRIVEEIRRGGAPP